MEGVHAAVVRITGSPVAEILVDRPERAVARVDAGAGRSFVKLDRRVARLDRERAVIRHLNTASTAEPLAPELLGHGVDADGAGFLWLGDVSAEPTEPVLVPPRRLGLAVARLHLRLAGLSRARVLDTPWPRHLAEVLDHAAARLGDAGLLSPRRLRRLRRGVPDHPVALAVTHGDLKPEHVFARSAGVSFIDFADARVADPLWDIAVLGLERSDWIEPLLEGYGLEPERARRRIDDYRLVRAASSAAIALARHRPVDELRALLEELTAE